METGQDLRFRSSHSLLKIKHSAPSLLYQPPPFLTAAPRSLSSFSLYLCASFSESRPDTRTSKRCHHIFTYIYREKRRSSRHQTHTTMCGILAVLGVADNSQAKRSRIIELSRRYEFCSVLSF